jgi:hypothetical protein
VGTLIRRLGRLLTGGRATARMLDGFVDSLIQTFENCRPGLSDDALRSPVSVEEFFAQLYEKEKPRLADLVALQYAHLSAPERQALVDKIDNRIVSVVIPAYARVAGRFTTRERNDFYLAPSAWHGAERLGFSAMGMLLGAFVVWAPFIPLTAKEWVLVFALGGLVFPDLRRVFAWKRYESDLNDVVGRTDDEIFRMDLELLTHEDPPVAAPTVPAREKDRPVKTPPRAREGGR